MVPLLFQEHLSPIDNSSVLMGINNNLHDVIFTSLSLYYKYNRAVVDILKKKPALNLKRRH